MSLLREAQKCIANQASLIHLKAFVNLPSSSSLLAQVEHAASADTPGPLQGKLIAVKDNIVTTDLPTTAASGILKGFKSPYNATVVQQLRENGAVVAGKTNMDEFGMGSHSKHSFFGAVKQEDSNGQIISAGGSSGGSAVAVATGQCWAALGTDTGGSVRLPAAYTSIIGFKPSYGLLSRWGVIAYANSLDTVGILSSTVSSALTIFDLLNTHDPKDPTSLLPSTRSRIAAATEKRNITRKRKPLRVGIPLEYNIRELSPIVRKTWVASLHHLRSQGASLHPISLPQTQHALSAYYVLAPAEASSNLAKYDGVRYGSRAPGPDGTPSSVLFSKTRGEGFGAEVKRRILLGAFTLSADAIDNYFIKAQKVRRLVQRDFNTVFAAEHPLLDQNTADALSDTAQEGKVDVVVCPTAPTLPPSLEEVDKMSPVDAYMNDVFTVPASLAGLPAISVPVKWESGGGVEGREKVGIQVIGQFGDDHLVLDVAKMLEEAG